MINLCEIGITPRPDTLYSYKRSYLNYTFFLHYFHHTFIHIKKFNSSMYKNLDIHESINVSLIHN